MTTDKKLIIGLFGFGVVGEGIYQVLQRTPTLKAEIKSICIKHPEKLRNAPSELFTTEANQILFDPQINVVVELIDDAEAAYHLVTAALKQGKHVVSANKKMIAAHLTELLQLQEEYGVSLLYEASVCGSIPVIRNLEEYYDNDLLQSFSGIINGSTNFILTRMREDQLSYDEALKLAQEAGYAESDPSLDVEGKDALNKLTIVLQHAYGLTCNPNEIVHKGITQLHALDTRYAEEKGYRIKLVANAKRNNENEIVAWVLPTLVSSDHLLSNVRNEFNAVCIGSALADEQFLYGKGAGRYPTSSAVLSDIAALRYNYRYEYKKSKASLNYHLSNEIFLRVYVSYPAGADSIENDFISVEEKYHSHTRNYLIGIVKLADLPQTTWYQHPAYSLILVGEAVTDAIESKFKEVELV